MNDKKIKKMFENLDELISLAEKKVELLKLHKIGLKQKLNIK